MVTFWISRANNQDFSAIGLPANLQKLRQKESDFAKRHYFSNSGLSTNDSNF